MGTSKRYTEAFKQKVLAEIDRGASIPSIQAKYGLGRSTAYKWVYGRSELKAPKIHVDSEVVKMKEALRKALFANYLAETGIDLN